MIITLLNSTPLSLALGYWWIRVSIGVIFLCHGIVKYRGGQQTWLWLGSQMNNLGINSSPIFWGAMAMLAETLGGLLLILGFGTRIAVVLISCVMVVALTMHLKKGDGYALYSYPLLVLLLMGGIFIAGSGQHSLDARLVQARVVK